MIGFIIYERYNQRVQQARNKVAEEIVDSIYRGLPADEFAVFLRPFVVDGKLTTGRLPSPYPLPPASSSSNDKYELQEVLANALADIAPLIGLSTLLGDVGAGKIATTDSEWQTLIEKLLIHSKYIFIIPGPQEGTLWEVETILSNNLLEKSIFILPPKSRDYAVKKYFEETKLAFRQLGLELPDNIGVIFNFRPNGQLKHVLRLPSAALIHHASLFRLIEDFL